MRNGGGSVCAMAGAAGRRLIRGGLLLLALAPASVMAQPLPSQVELVPQLGHSSRIGAAAFSRDGRTIVSAGDDRMVKIWDAATGRELRTLKGHSHHVNAVAVSPDGRTIVSGGSWEHDLRVWDAQTGRELRKVVGLSEGVSTVQFSPDGRTVVSCCLKGSLKLWEAATGRELRSFPGRGAFAFSPDGRILAAFDSGSALKLWDVESGRELRTLAAAGADTSVAFSPDGRTIVSGYWTLKLWDVATGRELRTFPGHKSRVGALGFSPDGRTIVSGSDDKTLKLWDVAGGRELRTIEAHRDDITAAAFSPDGRTILSASHDTTLKLWDPESGRLVRTFTGRAQRIDAIALSPDGRTIVSGGWDKALRIWDAASARQLRTLEGHDRYVSSVAFSADGRTIVSGSGDKTVKLWDAATGSERRTLKGHTDMVTTVAISPDGRTIASGSKDQSVRLWDVTNGRNLRTFRGAKTRIESVVFSPDGRTLVAAADRLTLWDVASGREIRSHGSMFDDVAFSPDGRTMVAQGGAGNVVYVRNVASGELLRSFEDPAALRKLAFSPDGRTLATGSGGTLGAVGGGDIKLWEAGSGRLSATLSGHGFYVTALAFMPDGHGLVSTGADRSMRRWSRDGALLATTFASTDGEWLTMTPEGFFDASEKGAQLLTAVRGLDTFSIDQFYQALYRPDLVREKLAGDPQGKVREAAAKLDLDKVTATGGAPNVVLAGPAKATTETIEVTATLTDAGGGIGKVEWRINGVTVGLEARGFDRLGAAPAPQPRPQTSAPLVLKRSLALSPGENVVEVVAYNAANLIASPSARLVVSREVASVQAEKPRLHVVAVGVNDYSDSRLKLSFATVDAKALGEALKRAGGSLYESVEVTTVLDDAATAANLDKTFATLAGKVRPDDVFVFFLAGHGKTIDGRYYFLPHDFRYAGDETIVSRGIGQDRWQDWFARIPARKSLLLYDTCESGSLTGDRVAMRGIERVAALERMTRATGRTTLTASTDDAPALEGYRGHGVFTYALLDALGKADGNGDGMVDVTELANFVDTQVPELSFQAFKQRQFPQMRIVGSNFPVATKASLLPVGGGEATAPVPTKPTHVVITPADVFAQAGGTGGPATRLPAGTLVTLVRSERGWVLIARDGKALGFVAQQNLLAAQ